MWESRYRFGAAFMLIALLFLTGCAVSKETIRIDGSSDGSVEQSYKRMLNSLNQDRQMKLVMAILQLNMIGVDSAKEMLADSALRHPGPVRIKDKIAGLDSGEIVALANKTATVKTYLAGQEPGMPADLLTPLAAGEPIHSLVSTTWHFVWNTNGFLKEQTLAFGADGTLKTLPPSTNGASTWEQSADEVRVFINDRYLVARGKFVDANHMQGTDGNRSGETWTWSADRK